MALPPKVTHRVYPETMVTKRGGRGTGMALCGRRVRLPEDDCGRERPSCPVCQAREDELETLEI
jgi:hypothetical protein